MLIKRWAYYIIIAAHEERKMKPLLMRFFRKTTSLFTGALILTGTIFMGGCAMENEQNIPITHDAQAYAAYYDNAQNLGSPQSIHFNLPENIGDVHPYYKNNKMYMFYLITDGTFASALLTSTNLLRYEKQEIKHDNHLPSRPYYVLNVIEDEGGIYRSFFGANNTYESSQSEDLLFWKQGMQTSEDFETLYRVPTPYPAGGRDPFVFLDEDINRYRIISTMYYTNAEWQKGEGMDCALVLSTSDDGTLQKLSNPPHEILRFTNGYEGEPEVSQMLKLGSRWYLFASLARRTPHHVGPVSYWAGESGKTIDETAWRPEKLLTGEDLCAAQVVPVGKHYYVFGWVPTQSRGNQWGGSLNLPRELYAKPDGTLATRFDPYLKELLKGEKIDEIGTNNFENAIVLEGCFTPKQSEFLEITISANDDLCTVVINKKQNLISILAKDGYVHSEIQMPDSETELYDIFLVKDDDIIEICVNDEVVLCARIDSKMPSFEVKVQSVGIDEFSYQLFSANHA